MRAGVLVLPDELPIERQYRLRGKSTKTLACFLATAQLKLLNISTQSNVNLTMLSLKCWL